MGFRQEFSPPAPAARPMILDAVPDKQSAIVLPLDETIARYDVTFKGFGEYIEDRFTGYHVGEDIEIPSDHTEVSVQSIADGTVLFVDWVSGYGGLVVIRHLIDEKTINSLYGHLDISSVSAKVGDPISAGQFIGYLGEGNTKETDQERQHLHFALYQGEELRKNGYEKKAEDVKKWINPTDFFLAHTIPLFRSRGLEKEFSALTLPPQASEFFPIQFSMSDSWEAEYVPSLKAVNLYTRDGVGSARERSQVFLRYFDASDFLTLSTVTIYSTETVTLGKNAYEARQYEIEKKPAVADFFDQPSWRNTRHVVTDFRGQAGKTRYYVVAANPSLDTEVYEGILASMEILLNN